MSEQTESETADTGMKGTAIAIGLCMAGLLALPLFIPRGGNPAQDEAARLEVLASRGMSDSDGRQYTKAEFLAAVDRKTKAEVRAMFGQPDRVDDHTDSWTYMNVPVFDADAGTKAMATIRFEGLNSADDRVVDVSYF